jgi:hypothetical protein
MDGAPTLAFPFRTLFCGDNGTDCVDSDSDFILLILELAAKPAEGNFWDPLSIAEISIRGEVISGQEILLSGLVN